MSTDPNVGETVKISVQSTIPNTPNRALKGFIEDVGKKQIFLLTDEDIEKSADITAQTEHLLFLGHVRNSLARLDGKWVISVTVKRTVAML